MYRLMALAARAKCADHHYHLLAWAAAQLEEWDGVPTRAEAEGVAPLLYVHLTRAGVPLPQAVKRKLLGLYLRHRHANQIRAAVLADLLAVYQAAGIPALVLKGAALAHLVYPESGLRPFSDIDLLVPKAKAIQAQSLLADLGFHAPLPPGDVLPGKHLAAATRFTGGILISVEVHHNLFNTPSPFSMELDDLTTPLRAFCLPGDGSAAYTLGDEEMLWHLCQHGTVVNALFATPRLIWLADIVSLAERYATEIDWPRLQTRYPLVLNTLSLLHTMTPLSDTLLNRAALKPGRVPQGLGKPFRGWPNASLSSQRPKGYRRLLLDTFFPSEWWLRLYYGLGSIRPVFWCRWLRHPLRIMGWSAQLLWQQVKQVRWLGNSKKRIGQN
ncbi:MAG: nucleotidyltransferase family protein [Anaerolineae bacterium]|nr:nucleotidyltransferase family protein [Anaerolineae bacterium]